MSEEKKPEEQTKIPALPLKKVKPKKDKPKTEIKPQEQPKHDEKMKSIDDAIKKQQDRFKEKEDKKPEGGPAVINVGVLDGIKKEFQQLPFLGHGGMLKAVTTSYYSCTDEFGKLTVGIDQLGNKIDSYQKTYFKKHFGEWKEGDQKIGRTLGDMIYKEYLGDVKQVLKPLEEMSKDKITPYIISEKVLSPLAGHFNEKVSGLYQNKVVGLSKEDKDKLKDELVSKSQQLGRPLTKVELIDDHSLVKAVYGILQEEDKREYDSKMKGKPLFGG